MDALVYSRSTVDRDRSLSLAWKLIESGDISFPGGTMIAFVKFFIWNEMKNLN